MCASGQIQTGELMSFLCFYIFSIALLTVESLLLGCLGDHPVNAVFHRLRLCRVGFHIFKQSLLCNNRISLCRFARMRFGEYFKQKEASLKLKMP
jgi:hypothetical protein